MKHRHLRVVWLVCCLFVVGGFGAREAGATPAGDALAATLAAHGFTGRVESTLPDRLGRDVDHRLADLGRALWFDTIAGLNDDNSCGGCHSPLAAFGDTQSIAIGIDNNGVVGPGRTGPRNQRRTPSAINTALYPRLMWNGRFSASSGDPFDNSLGFVFPPPEGTSLSYTSHLLVAQAFIPTTERVEAAGFDFVGDNDAIRAEVVNRLNDAPGYVTRFGEVFPSVAAGGAITYDMFAQAIAELEFTLVFANAPIDKFARGHRQALTERQIQGGLLFFGKAGCVNCHAVSGASNEMFSDFENHVIGVPQVSPSVTNIVFDGPGQNEDFGMEQVTGDANDRYRFRTSPLRNVALQPAFMHNGAFTKLEDAIRHHLDVEASVASYTTAGLAPDLQGPLGPMDPVLDRLDPALWAPTVLTDDEFDALLDFVAHGLTDERATQTNLDRFIPPTLPSGNAPLTFEAACSEHVQCGPGMFCDAGECAAGAPDGAVCSEDAECNGGVCVSGTCGAKIAQTCVVIERGVSGKVEDAFLSGDYPKWKTGSEPTAWTGKSSGGNDNFTIVKWSLNAIPKQAKILSAHARIAVGWNVSLMDISAHPMTAHWTESSATYKKVHDPAGWDAMPFARFHAGGAGPKEMDVTALVADWVSGAWPNEGLLLQEPHFDAHMIATSEWSSLAMRPRLDVCYAMP